MVSNLIEAAPYTIYRYYKDVHTDACKQCHDTTSHLLLRYRNYMFSKHPFIPTNTQFYLICSQCYHMTELEGEGIQMPYVFKARQQKAITYTKLDLLNLVTEDTSVTSENFFDYNVKAHLEVITQKS